MSKYFTALLALLVGVISFSATAHAADAVIPADSSLLDMAKPVYEAVMHGQWWLGASLALVLMVAAFKRYAPGKAGEFAHSDTGGAILVLVGSFGGALATGLAAVGTNSISTALAWTALKVAFGAAGGYSLAKKLLAPLLTKMQAKAPLWAQPLFSMVLWIFDSKAAVVQAEADGQAAVDAKPAAGADSVTGKPTDLS